MQIKREGKSCSIYFFTIDVGLLLCRVKDPLCLYTRQQTITTNTLWEWWREGKSDTKYQSLPPDSHVLLLFTAFFSLSLIFLRLDCLCTQLSRSFSWNHPVGLLSPRALPWKNNETWSWRKSNHTVVASATNHPLGVYTKRRLHRIISTEKEVRPVVTRNLQFLLLPLLF